MGFRENAPHWKGGRRVTEAGYVDIYAPEHPRAKGNGYVAEHILVAEKALGKPLPAGAEVHHVNLDRADNRSCNLVICPSKEYHRLLHTRMGRTRRAPHRVPRCRRCKQADDLSRLRTNGDGSRVHPECERAYNNARYARKMARTGT